MGGQFQESGLYAAAERIGVFLLTNLISAFLLLTVLAAPLALLALFAVMNAWVQGRQPEFFAVYLGSIRRHWRAALALGFIDLLAGGLIAFNLNILPAMALDFLTVLSLTMTFSVGAVLLLANLYAWSLLSLLRLPLRETIKLSLLLTLSQPLRSVLLTLAAFAPLLASLFLPVAFMLILSLSVAAYIAARGVWWVLRAHFSPAELADLLEPA